VTKRLIVNADDYGLTAGVSRGILEAHLNGIITSTTVMIASPGVEEALHKAALSAPKLGLGLHLTFSGTGRPLLPPSEVPSLVREDGRLLPASLWATRVEQLDADDIRRELVAQCERFIEIVGRPPDHLDAHHHAVYRHQGAFEITLDLASRYKIPIRNANFGGEKAVRGLLEGIPTRYAAVLAEHIQAWWQSGTRPNMPTHFEYHFYGDTATLGDLLLILTNLPDNSITELMCHPGYVDDALDSDYTAKREEEIRALTHRSTHEVIKAEGIELINFSALKTGEAV
jgi:chitin disaccharide deacetylase